MGTSQNHKTAKRQRQETNNKEKKSL